MASQITLCQFAQRVQMIEMAQMSFTAINITFITGRHSKVSIEELVPCIYWHIDHSVPSMLKKNSLFQNLLRKNSLEYSLLVSLTNLVFADCLKRGMRWAGDIIWLRGITSPMRVPFERRARLKTCIPAAGSRVTTSRRSTYARYVPECSKGVMGRKPKRR